MGESNKPKRRSSFQAEEVPLTDDTTCGIGCFKGTLLQRFANKSTFIVLYGCLGLCQAASWAYFNGTITTMEKRFKIPSKITGLITIGGDISGLFTTIFLSYWAGNGHRPRWIAFGTFTSMVQMFLTTLPHLIYGAGEDSLNLTAEFGGDANITFVNSTKLDSKYLCGGGVSCTQDYGSVIQPAILFLAQSFGGIGGGLHYTLGITYIDDNVKKSETPFFVSLSFFIRMIGPSIGYAIASACLKYYISPTLTPTIPVDDPRWIGAWWMGWLLLGTIMFILTVPMSLYPKVLPATVAKKAMREEKEVSTQEVKEPDTPPSLKGMVLTIKRLFKNKIFFYNNLAAIFYCLGEDPYWVYLAKYIETQYKQTASAANFVTGTIGLGSSAAGILLSGLIISKCKPTARQLAAWNVFVGFLTIAGIFSYIFITCDESLITKSNPDQTDRTNFTRQCNADCSCEYIPYTPICSENNETFISACHAGCSSIGTKDGVTIYSNCACVAGTEGPGTAKAGICPVDCTNPFYLFVFVISILKLTGAAGVASNFLVGVRCIDEKDKSAAMGLSLALLCSLAFAPAPVLFGYILDTTCLVWGKTCTGKGNCWIYDGKNLAYVLNLTASFFVTIGTLFDVKVWYHSKDVKIFD